MTMRAVAETGGLVLPPSPAADPMDVSTSDGLTTSMSRVSVSSVSLSALSSKSSRDNLLSHNGEPSMLKPSMSSRYSSLSSSQETTQLLPPLEILENMTAATEVRGGQAGGYSVVEHKDTSTLSTPVVHRVRLVARKRVPLAADLAREYLRETGGHNPNPQTASLTCIGHTRFATSSINVVPELHPHEWTPWRIENVWRLNAATGLFAREPCLVGCHITHNGDFDALDAYSAKMTNGEVGLWLERVLHVTNNTRGDSPKVAGIIDLLRVQGRWAAASRLAWVKCVCMQALDVTGGQQLEKSAPNQFPKPAFFYSWGLLFENVWAAHKSRIVRKEDGGSTYSIDVQAERLLVDALVQALDSDDKRHLEAEPVGVWEEEDRKKKTRGLAAFLGLAGTDKLPSPGADDESIDNSVHSGDLAFGKDVEQGGPSPLPVSASSKRKSIKKKPRFKSFSMSAKADPCAGLDDDGSSVESDSPEEPRDGSTARKSKSGLKKFLRAHDMSPTQARNFFTTCVRGFLRADLYSAVVEFLARAEGSFGLQVHSSAEPGVVVIASKGQPMSLSFDPIVPMVLFGSEAGALGVPVDRSGKWLSRRIDLDNAGEIVRIGEPRLLEDGTFTSNSLESNFNCTSEEPPFHLMLQCGIQLCSYSLAGAGEARLPQLLARITHVSSTVRVFDPKIDLVRADLDAMPLVLSTIDRTWSNPKSLEFAAAGSLGAALLDCMRERLDKRQGTTDLVISGVEASLWLAESFAADIRGVFPGINVITLSSNKLLGLGLPRAGIVYFPGSVVVEETLLSSKTCFLLVSQSGQTFPALHSTSTTSRYLKNQRLWLMTATFNSRMEKVIRDDHAVHGKTYGNDRVINVLCGHRPAEPSSVVVAATWHTLSRLLLFLVKYSQQNCAEGCAMQPWDESSARIGSGDNRPPVPMALSRGCVQDLEALFNERLVQNVAEIVGSANENQSVYTALVKQGVAWGEHIREPWSVLVICGAYIIVSVGAGLPICGLLGDAIAAIIQAFGVDLGTGTLADSSPRHLAAMQKQPLGWTLVGFFINLCDALWFIFLAKNFTRISRWIAGRPQWARMGKRTIVIVDSPTNHQLLESFVSKLFSQSYSHTSVDVHGASGLDHFVHRFTHRVVRGVLLAAGRCDGRVGTLAKSELATLLALKQAAFITNPDYPETRAGSGPEIVTIGHNPYKASLGLSHQICIQASVKRKLFLEEYLYERLHLAAKPFTQTLLRCLRDQYRVLQASEKPLALRELPFGSHHIPPPSGKGGSLLLQFMMQAKDLMARRRTRAHRKHGHNQRSLGFFHSLGKKIVAFVSPAPANHHKDADEKVAPQDVPPNDDPSAREAFSMRFDEEAQAIQDRQVHVQHLYESRVASLERYIAFCVLFHAMAAHCRKPWLLLPWDMARSQSNLRIATTASPVAVVEQGGDHHHSVKAKKQARKFAALLRGSSTYF